MKLITYLNLLLQLIENKNQNLVAICSCARPSKVLKEKNEKLKPKYSIKNAIETHFLQ